MKQKVQRKILEIKPGIDIFSRDCQDKNILMINGVKEMIENIGPLEIETLRRDIHDETKIYATDYWHHQYNEKWGTFNEKMDPRIIYTPSDSKWDKVNRKMNSLGL